MESSDTKARQIRGLLVKALLQLESQVPLSLLQEEWQLYRLLWLGRVQDSTTAETLASNLSDFSRHILFNDPETNTRWRSLDSSKLSLGALIELMQQLVRDLEQETGMFLLTDATGGNDSTPPPYAPMKDRKRSRTSVTLVEEVEAVEMAVEAFDEAEEDEQRPEDLAADVGPEEFAIEADDAGTYGGPDFASPPSSPAATPQHSAKRRRMRSSYAAAAEEFVLLGELPQLEGGSRSRKELRGRWSKDRYEQAQRSLIQILQAAGATSPHRCVLRPTLREEARKVIGDTGLLDHLLKHMAEEGVKVDGCSLRRRHNSDGHMEYWVQMPGSEHAKQRHRHSREGSRGGDAGHRAEGSGNPGNGGGDLEGHLLSEMYELLQDHRTEVLREQRLLMREMQDHLEAKMGDLQVQMERLRSSCVQLEQHVFLHAEKSAGSLEALAAWVQDRLDERRQDQ